MKKYNILYERIQTEKEIELGDYNERRWFFPEATTSISQLAQAIQYMKTGDQQTPSGQFRFSVISCFEEGDYILNLQTLEVRLYKDTNNGIITVYDTDDTQDVERMKYGFTRYVTLNWLTKDCEAFNVLDSEYIVGRKDFGTTSKTQNMIFEDMTNL